MCLQSYTLGYISKRPSQCWDLDIRDFIFVINQLQFVRKLLQVFLILLKELSGSS